MGAQRTQPRPHARACVRARTDTHASSGTDATTRTHTRTHIHTHAHTHACPRIRTHTNTPVHRFGFETAPMLGGRPSWRPRSSAHRQSGGLPPHACPPAPPPPPHANMHMYMRVRSHTHTHTHTMTGQETERTLITRTHARTHAQTNAATHIHTTHTHKDQHRQTLAHVRQCKRTCTRAHATSQARILVFVGVLPPPCSTRAWENPLSTRGFPVQSPLRTR